MVRFKNSGDFSKTFNFFGRALSAEYLDIIHALAKEGVVALAASTPVDTGLSASSWSYEVKMEGRKTSIYWTNDNLTKTNVPVVILLQYGHGTGTGGYVAGKNFINPAIAPVFDRISSDVWKEVVKV